VKKHRPIAVTVIAWIFLASGLIGLVYHAKDFNSKGPVQFDLVSVSLVRLLAVIGAVFLLRGRNWARWLLVLWLAYHVGLSTLHSTSQTVMHALLLAVIAAFLFRPPASAYFRPIHLPSERNHEKEPS
jgi:hypothetical protein